MIKIKKSQLKEIVEGQLKEYFSMVGSSLPTYGSVTNQTMGPFLHQIRSISQSLQKIREYVDNKDIEMDDIDAQELTDIFLPNLERLVSTIKNSVERRKSGSPGKKKPKPLVPPQER